MESVTGQVRKIKFAEKWSDYVKKTKHEKKHEQELALFYNELSAAKSELNSIRQNLDLITDTDAKEYYIYRLKAAELQLNRYIKLAKSLGLISEPYAEETL